MEEKKKEEAEKKKDKDKVVRTPRDHIHEDLERLLQRPCDRDAAIPGENDDEDLPPLIQALTRSAKHDGKKAVLERQLKELEEREMRRREMER